MLFRRNIFSSKERYEDRSLKSLSFSLHLLFKSKDQNLRKYLLSNGYLITSIYLMEEVCNQVLLFKNLQLNICWLADPACLIFSYKRPTVDCSRFIVWTILWNSGQLSHLRTRSVSLLSWRLITSSDGYSFIYLLVKEDRC